MKLSSLNISAVRNIADATLPGLGDINIIFGHNGAGKTTVLECIHMLALARSFRSTALKPLIQRDAEQCTVAARLQREGRGEIALGIRRSRSGAAEIRIDGEKMRSALQLAQTLPIQLINASSYMLVDGGPKLRRQFIDWGVFHVEQAFYNEWRRVQRALKQRNATLRAGGGASDLAPWDKELTEAGEAIDSARDRYMRRFLPVFGQMLAQLADLEGISLDYARGWPQDQSLQQAMQESLLRDRARGLSHVGPHRADIRIQAQGVDAAQVLSRGQQKLLVCALRLAQTRCLFEQAATRCLLLVDDLPAEMDAGHQRRLCGLLASQGMQLFITCIDPGELRNFSWPADKDLRWFHVEHGEIAPA